MRHALITAGTKGLGLKVTEALLKNGYSVTVTYYSDEKRAAELANQWDKNVLQLIKADVGNKADCEMLVKKMPSFSKEELIYSFIMLAHIFLRRKSWLIMKITSGTR